MVMLGCTTSNCKAVCDLVVSINQKKSDFKKIKYNFQSARTANYGFVQGRQDVVLPKQQKAPLVNRNYTATPIKQTIHWKFYNILKIIEKMFAKPNSCIYICNRLAS